MTQSGMLSKDELIHGPQPCGGARLYGIGSPRPGALRKISIVSHVLEHPPTPHDPSVTYLQRSPIMSGLNRDRRWGSRFLAQTSALSGWHPHPLILRLSLPRCIFAICLHAFPAVLPPAPLHPTFISHHIVCRWSRFCQYCRGCLFRGWGIEGRHLLATNISDETGFLGLDCKFYAIESSIPYSASNYFSLFWPDRFLLDALSATGKLFAPTVETSVRLFFSSSFP